ncbi:MAG: hypothetical protein V1674_01295 [Candidatus Omnitrophota bacterium]
MARIIFIILFLTVFCANSFAAVGCSLNDPDRDVKRIFAESTGYRTTFITLKEIGAEPLQKEIEQKLGDKFDPVYESLDVPYAYYTVLKGKDTIGRIHGVNQKGRYGSMQLILATDLKGKIIEFYYQRISSPESKRFRDKAFTGQFKGLSLGDFYGDGRVSKIADPSKANPADFKATLRGIKKNLLLLDEFLRL